MRSMSDWAGTGISVIGFVLIWVSIVQMVLWYRANPAMWQMRRRPRAEISRTESREAARSLYGRFWPLCGALGIFLMGFGAILDGDTTAWRVALNVLWGGITVAALIAYLRFRRP